MKKILKNIRFIPYEYAQKPILLYSAFSVIVYLLMLLKVDNAYKLIFIGFVICLFFCLFKRIKKKIYKIILLIFCIALLFFYFCFSEKLIFFIAEKCAKNNIAFGGVSSLLNSVGIYDLNNLIYNSSLGGARFYGGKIICGAVNIANSIKSSNSALYLTGRILALFSLSGVLLTAKADRKHKFLLILFLLSSGLEAPCLLFLLLCEPALYFLFLILSFAGYLLSSILSVKAVFRFSPSVFEAIFLSDNKIYLICLCVLFCAVSYYLSRLVKERRI